MAGNRQMQGILKKIKSNFLHCFICFHFSGPEAAFTTALPSDPVHLAHTVTLQCSILRDFQNKSCPTDKKMFCLSAKSHQSHLDLNYSCVNGEDEYEKNPEGLSAKACFYS